MPKPKQTPQPVEQRFFSLPATALYLNLCERSVQRLVKDGKLRAYQITPNRIAFDRHELDAYVLASPTGRRQRQQTMATV